MEPSHKVFYPEKVEELAALREELLAQKSALESKLLEIDAALSRNAEVKAGAAKELAVPDYKSKEFAEGLGEHFHRAKRKALSGDKETASK